MLKSILINRSSVYLITLTILFIQSVNGTGEKSSCHLYGHSCLGAHGKRSNELSQSTDSKLIPQDFDKYSYQIPSLEGQMINDRLYNRLINYLRSSNTASGNGLPLNYPMTAINNPLNQLNQLNQLNSIDQLSKTKRYEAGKLSLDDIKNYLKSNDYVNKNSKKSINYDDY